MDKEYWLKQNLDDEGAVVHGREAYVLYSPQGAVEAWRHPDGTDGILYHSPVPWFSGQFSTQCAILAGACYSSEHYEGVSDLWDDFPALFAELEEKWYSRFSADKSPCEVCEKHFDNDDMHDCERDTQPYCEWCYPDHLEECRDCTRVRMENE